MNEKTGTIKPIDAEWAKPEAPYPPTPKPLNGQIAQRRATVAVIRAVGDAQIAGGLVDAATAREIRIKDAEIKAVRLELDLRRGMRATNIKARLACVRAKYALRSRTAMQRIGDQIGVVIALACCAWDAIRRGWRRRAWQ